MSNPDLKDAIFIDAPTELQKNETKEKEQEVYKKQLFEILDIKEDDGDNINEKAKIAYEEKMEEYESSNSPDLQEVINLTKLYGEFLKTIRPEANKVKEISTSDNRDKYSSLRTLIQTIVQANIPDAKRDNARSALFSKCENDYNKMVELLFNNQDCFDYEDLGMIFRQETSAITGALLDLAWKSEEAALFAKKIMEENDVCNFTEDVQEVPGIIYKLSKIIFGNSYIMRKECRTFFIECLFYITYICPQEVEQIINEVVADKNSSIEDLYQALEALSNMDREKAKKIYETILIKHPEKDRINFMLEEWAEGNIRSVELSMEEINWKRAVPILEEFCAEEITIKNESILNDYISALMDVPVSEDLDKIEKILDTIYAKKDISIFIEIQIAYVMAEFNNSRALEMSEELSKHSDIKEEKIATAFNTLKKHLQEV